MLMTDAEGRKKEASKVIQTTKQSNTAHPRQPLFQGKMSGTHMHIHTSYIMLDNGTDTHAHLHARTHKHAHRTHMRRCVVNESAVAVNDG